MSSRRQRWRVGVGASNVRFRIAAAVSSLRTWQFSLKPAPPHSFQAASSATRTAASMRIRTALEARRIAGRRDCRSAWRACVLRCKRAPEDACDSLLLQIRYLSHPLTTSLSSLFTTITTQSRGEAAATPQQQASSNGKRSKQHTATHPHNAARRACLNTRTLLYTHTLSPPLALHPLTRPAWP